MLSGGQDDDTTLQNASVMNSFVAESGIQAPVQSELETNSDSPSRRTRQLSDIYNNYSFALHVVDPVTYEDAAKSSEWQAVMHEKMDSIQRNNKWVLAGTVEDKKIIGLKWIFKTKYQTNGEVQKLKAKIVAKGYTQ